MSLLNPDGKNGEALGGGRTGMSLAEYVDDRMSPMNETFHRNVSSMFLPGGMNDFDRGVLRDWAPPWQFQDHGSCRRSRWGRAGLHPEERPPPPPPPSSVSALKLFIQYDADRSGQLERRTMPEAGAIFGITDAGFVIVLVVPRQRYQE